MTLDLVHCVSLVAQSCLFLCNPMDRSPPVSSVHGDSPGRNTGEGCHAIFQGIFPTQAGIKSQSPALQVVSLPAELSGKPLYKLRSQYMLVVCHYILFIPALIFIYIYIFLKTIYIGFHKMTAVFLTDSMFPVLLLLLM